MTFDTKLDARKLSPTHGAKRYKGKAQGHDDLFMGMLRPLWHRIQRKRHRRTVKGTFGYHWPTTEASLPSRVLLLPPFMIMAPSLTSTLAPEGITDHGHGSTLIVKVGINERQPMDEITLFTSLAVILFGFLIAGIGVICMLHRCRRDHSRHRLIPVYHFSPGEDDEWGVLLMENEEGVENSQKKKPKD